MACPGTKGSPAGDQVKEMLLARCSGTCQQSRRQRQEDPKFQADLHHLVRPCLKNIKEAQ